MKAKCLIEVYFPDEKSVEIAIKALSHEGDIGNRSNVKMTKKDSLLRLEISADDVVALRATANACLRGMQVFEQIEETSTH